VSLFARLVEKISDHPVLFIFFRGLLENDFKAIRALIRRELRVGQGLSTLDLGCGPGAFSDLFDGDDYVGADLNARYIDHAQKKRKGTFLHADARQVPFAPVVCISADQPPLSTVAPLASLSVQNPRAARAVALAATVKVPTNVWPSSVRAAHDDDAVSFSLNVSLTWLLTTTSTPRTQPTCPCLVRTMYQTS